MKVKYINRNFCFNDDATTYRKEKGVWKACCKPRMLKRLVSEMTSSVHSCRKTEYFRVYVIYISSFTSVTRKRKIQEGTKMCEKVLNHRYEESQQVRRLAARLQFKIYFRLD